MYIVQIASEIAPVAKVGGLADVMMGLSRELKWKGHQVDIFVPKYDCLDTRYLQFTPKKKTKSYFQGTWHDNTIVTSKLNGDLLLTFIDAHHPARFFERGAIYGSIDDIDRFLYFSRACLDYLKSEGTPPNVIHIHDWETAIIALLVKDPYFEDFFSKTKVVLTIHNMDYQGRCSVFNLDAIGLPGAQYKELLQHTDTQDVNLLKAGIIFADAVATVSPTYAQEVLKPEGGKGLQDVLNKYRKKFFGILNGLDYSYWNPEVDRFMVQKYSSDTVDFRSLKEKNKWHLLDEFKLQKSKNKPLIAAIARLVPQKGIELLKNTLTYAQEKGAQYILLGTAPDPAVHKEFSELAERYASHPDIRIILRSEEALAHRLYAASDIFIVPSIFEPCGLTQLIAMKYGSIPVVRATGGLKDTVFDVDMIEHGNGFTFDSPDIKGLHSALDRAVKMYKEKVEKWQKLMVQAMKYDYSWNKPADQYLDIYQ